MFLLAAFKWQPLLCSCHIPLNALNITHCQVLFLDLKNKFVFLGETPSP
uniref:Uncharacterized protein n=1 Tax=Arundo donax TaxID=35708 RepID=A0A0A9H0H2_ARUDO